MPIVTRPPINSNNDNEHSEALANRQTRNYKTIDYVTFSKGSTVAVQQEDGGLWTQRGILLVN